MVKEFVLIEHGEYNLLKDNPTIHDNEIVSDTAPGTSMLSTQHLLSTVKSKVVFSILAIVISQSRNLASI